MGGGAGAERGGLEWLVGVVAAVDWCSWVTSQQLLGGCCCGLQVGVALL